jgi:hypothetical protein
MTGDIFRFHMRSGKVIDTSNKFTAFGTNGFDFTEQQISNILQGVAKGDKAINFINVECIERISK